MLLPLIMAEAFYELAYNARLWGRQRNSEVKKQTL